jgi:hypothetical protein
LGSTPAALASSHQRPQLLQLLRLRGQTASGLCRRRAASEEAQAGAPVG